MFAAVLWRCKRGRGGGGVGREESYLRCGRTNDIGGTHGLVRGLRKKKKKKKKRKKKKKKKKKKQKKPRDVLYCWLFFLVFAGLKSGHRICGFMRSHSCDEEHVRTGREGGGV